MKRILLALGFLCLLTMGASAATCAVTSVQVKGNDGTVVQMAVTDDGTGSGNCMATVHDPSAIPAGTNQIGFVGLQANTTGGCTPGHILTAASNNSTSLKGSAGTLCSVTFLNTTTGTFDIRFYDTASAPTCSSATGVVLNLVALTDATSPGFSINLGPFGALFATGIGVCITGANADNDNTNAATGGNFNYTYK